MSLKIPIIVFQGGLGNQLSQWSFAHAISGSEGFQIDPLHGMSGIQSRNFELQEVFNHCEHIKNIESNKLIFPSGRIFFHLLDRLWELRILRGIVEAFGYFREDPRVDQEQTSVIPKTLRYAKGYFQKQQNVQKVFCSVEKEIMPLVDKLLPIVRKKFSLDSQYTVMHVRRGDYDTAEFSPIIIGTLSDRYFINGLKEMDTSNLILLTENREDVRDLVKVLNPRMILDKFDTTPWETLAIMYGASQFLGANSSLSWWGARLCSANGGEVWLPSQWSYWKNIDPTDYHFPGIKIADVYWVQDNHLS